MRASYFDPMSPRKEPPFVYPVTVEFEDIDSYHIAHHTRLVAYLERARVNFFSRLGLDLVDGGFNLVIYRLNMRFIKSAQILDSLQIAVFVESLDSVRIVLGYKIMRDGDLLAKASTDLAFIDTKTHETIPVPAQVSAAVKPYCLTSKDS